MDIGNRMVTISFARLWRRKYTVKIEYDADVFQTEDDKKISHPVGTGTKIVMAVMLLVVPGILLLLIIRAYKKGKPVDSYRAESGFGNAFTDIRTSSHYTGGRGSGGCACACACACAGGGRAGCSKKIFTEQSLRQWQSARR